MGTPHNEAEKGEIAKRVLMPGDPLRAKYIAEHFLEDAVCFNTVRNMLGYTGTYKGEKISVMGGGMGVPSVGIYTYELYHEYEVEEIIRKRRIITRIIQTTRNCRALWEIRPMIMMSLCGQQTLLRQQR